MSQLFVWKWHPSEIASRVHRKFILKFKLTLKHTSRLNGIVSTTRTQDRKMRIRPHVDASPLVSSSALESKIKQRKEEKFIRNGLNSLWGSWNFDCVLEWKAAVNTEEENANFNPRFTLESRMLRDCLYCCFLHALITGLITNFKSTHYITLSYNNRRNRILPFIIPGFGLNISSVHYW